MSPYILYNEINIQIFKMPKCNNYFLVNSKFVHIPFKLVSKFVHIPFKLVFSFL